MIGGIRKRGSVDTRGTQGRRVAGRPLPRSKIWHRHGVTGNDRAGRPVRRCRLGKSTAGLIGVLRDLIPGIGPTNQPMLCIVGERHRRPIGAAKPLKVARRVILQLRHATRRVRDALHLGPTIGQRGHLPGRVRDGQQSSAAIIGIGGLVPVPIAQTREQALRAELGHRAVFGGSGIGAIHLSHQDRILIRGALQRDGGRARRQYRPVSWSTGQVGHRVQKEGAIRSFRIAVRPRTTRIA